MNADPGREGDRGPTSPPMGENPQPALSHRPLPTGTRLRNFVITRYLGEGGFGIVYVANDELLQRDVAIKEYLPAALATRGEDNTVVPLSARERETFGAGLAGFLEEARLLARFDHPNLVKVLDFWEANGTAYMAMPYYRGVTLRNMLRERPEPPDEAWLKSLLRPLCDALGEIHAQQCVHRDISPDNILMLGSGQPLLLDFGAARRVIADATQDLTVILKPGFAPIEQYGDSATARQGPWSDVYALAAVVYFAITGSVPKAAVGRIMKDDLRRFVDVGAGRYDAQFLQGLDRALSVRPEDRPASIEAFAASIGLGVIAPSRRIEASIHPGTASPSAAKPPAATPALTNDEATLVLPRAVDPDATVILDRSNLGAATPKAPPPNPSPDDVPHPAEGPTRARAPSAFVPPAPRRRPIWPLVAAVAALTAAVIAGMEMFTDPPPVTRPAAVPTAAPVPAATTPDAQAIAKPDTANPTVNDAPVPANVDPPARENAPAEVAVKPVPPAGSPAANAGAPQPAPAGTPSRRAPDASRANLPVSRPPAASAKCGEWLARLQLGETLSEQDMATFNRDCRK